MKERRCWICGESAHYFCSDGYKYMWCARLFNFELNDSSTKLTEISGMMLLGKQKHIEIEKLHSKQYWLHEPGKSIQIGDWVLHGHIDLVHRTVKLAREIKPKYSIRAYMQTLLYKLLYPEYIIQCLEYVTGKIFDLKADYNMAEVYFKRLVHASETISPRLPFFPNQKCYNCSYLQRCLNTPDYSWEQFTQNVNERFKVTRPLLVRPVEYLSEEK